MGGGTLEALSKSDVCDIMAINESTQENCGVEPLQKTALDALQKHLCCDAALFVIRSPGHWTRDFDRLAQRGLMEDFTPRYLAGPCADDPFAPFIRENPNWRFGVIASEKLVPREQWLKSRLCRELLLPAGVFHMLCMELVVDRKQAGLIGLFRSMKAGPFVDHDECKAALCTTAMAQALRRALDAEAESNRDRHLANAVSDATGVGIVVLDARLQVRFRTHAADVMLDQIAPCVVGPRTDVAPLPPDLQRLSTALRRRMLKSSFDQGPPLTQEIRISTARGVVLASITAVRLAGDTRYIISLRSEAARGCDKSKLVRIGLSPREAEVVMCVAAGLRNNDIAEHLFLSINTVQTHLRSVFAKLDVHNRAGLLSRVLCDAHRESASLS